jgi:hypothetical protein
VVNGIEHPDLRVAEIAFSLQELGNWPDGIVNVEIATQGRGN